MAEGPRGYTGQMMNNDERDTNATLLDIADYMATSFVEDPERDEMDRAGAMISLLSFQFGRVSEAYLRAMLEKSDVDLSDEVVWHSVAAGVSTFVYKDALVVFDMFENSLVDPDSEEVKFILRIPGMEEYIEETRIGGIVFRDLQVPMVVDEYNASQN